MQEPSEAPGERDAVSWRGWPVEGGTALAGIVTWGWLMTPLVGRPRDLVILAGAVPVIAAAVVVAERWRRGAGGAVLGVALVAGFLVLAAGSGGAVSTLVSFALGLLKPAAWQGEHLLLRVVPLALLVAFPLRPSWGTAVLSGLGVTAFVGIALAIARVAG